MREFLPGAVGIYNKRGNLIRSSVRLSRKMAKRHFAALRGKEWGELRRRGYRCRVVKCA